MRLFAAGHGTWCWRRVFGSRKLMVAFLSGVAACAFWAGGPFTVDGRPEGHGTEDVAEFRAIEGTVPGPKPLCISQSIGSRAPRGFEANVGQFADDVRFIARSHGASCMVDPTGFTVQLVAASRLEDPPFLPGHDDASIASSVDGVNLRFTFEGAAQHAAVEGVGPPQALMNYYIGPDPSTWRTAVPTYSKVSIRDINPGVNVHFRDVASGRMEYDLALAPGADLRSVVIVCEGAQALHISEDGRELHAVTQLGTLRQDLPGTWQTHADGSREYLECRFRHLGESRFGFEVAGRDPALELLIDPGLIYSTFLGGSGEDIPLSIAALPSGVVTVAGYTNSANFPNAPGVFTIPPGSTDAFVSRIDADGQTVLWSTYIGGSEGQDYATKLALDANGEVGLVGVTASVGFPITPGARAVHSSATYGNYDAFVVRLTAAGAVVYSTALGDSGNDVAHAVGFDQGGLVVAAGYTNSPQFPTTTGAYDTGHGGGGYYGDAFVTKLSADGTGLVWSTFLGGNGNDAIFDLCVDATNGSVTVAGFSQILNMPAPPPGSWNTTPSGSGGEQFASVALGDCLVARLTADGSGLHYAGLLGGSMDDAGFALSLDPAGGVVVAGRTRSSGWPVHGTLGGVIDGFVARISPTGSTLVASTYLGGPGDETVWGIDVDSSGAVTVVGSTTAAAYPTTAGCWQPNFGGGTSDAFVTQLASDLSTLIYSTYLGGSGRDLARDAGLDGEGGIYVAGNTTSGNFPVTTGVFDPIYGGGDDGFVTHMDLLPTGVHRYGSSTAGCSGPLAIGVSSAPSIGNAAFALTCLGAPPNAIGFLGVSNAASVTPVIALGAAIWIDLMAPGATFVLTTSNAQGKASFSWPLPPLPQLVGARGFAQFVWVDACAPGGLSASSALEIILQP